MRGGPIRPTIAFAGGGHAHLYSLRRTRELVRRGHDVVLVNPSPYLYYSGMATGVVSRTYEPEEDRIDVRRLVEGGGGRFVEGRVHRVFPSERALLLENGRRVPYDIASFCLGSGVRPLPADAQGPVLPVKPVENAQRLRDGISGCRSRVLVVGGGVAGCEVAANAASLVAKLSAERGAEAPEGSVALAEAGPRLLAGAPERARRLISAYLEDGGVEVLLGFEVSSFEGGVAVARDGREAGADLLVPATGVVPPAVFRRSGLATGDDGGLWVDAHLRSPNDARLFGGGDCVCFRGELLPRLGVFAVRQGPVLYKNLQAALRGRPLARFEPQRRYLYVLNLGDGTGLAIYGRLAWRGRLALKLKNLIDKRFVGEYS